MEQDEKIAAVMDLLIAGAEARYAEDIKDFSEGFTGTSFINHDGEIFFNEVFLSVIMLYVRELQLAMSKVGASQMVLPVESIAVALRAVHDQGHLEVGDGG